MERQSCVEISNYDSTMLATPLLIPSYACNKTLAPKICWRVCAIGEGAEVKKNVHRHRDKYKSDARKDASWLLRNGANEFSAFPASSRKVTRTFSPRVNQMGTVIVSEKVTTHGLGSRVCGAQAAHTKEPRHACTEYLYCFFSVGVYLSCRA